MICSHSFLSYRTGQYKLHYYETPTNIKFVMLTDVASQNMRGVLHQIYVHLYVEFGKCFNPATCHVADSFQVVKNPLAPVEHPGGEGVNNELFEMAVEQFVSGVL
jgi:hypothetical protein